MTFDISTLAIQESTVIHLTHPSNDEKLYVDKAGKMTFAPTDKDGKDNSPVTITVASTSSREYRSAVAAMQNRGIAREKQKKKMTAEIQKEEGISLLTAVCLGSENLVYKGNDVETASDFRALLSDDKMSWIKAQIDEAIGNVELFIDESLTS